MLCLDEGRTTQARRICHYNPEDEASKPIFSHLTRPWTVPTCTSAISPTPRTPPPVPPPPSLLGVEAGPSRFLLYAKHGVGIGRFASVMTTPSSFARDIARKGSGRQFRTQPLLRGFISGSSLCRNSKVLDHSVSRPGQRPRVVGMGCVTCAMRRCFVSGPV